tara:strand:- start:482 stop:916 length:435 start_codon:yes stop_codon:yes gene_type:complete
MKLTPHFTLAELTATSTGLDNTPNKKVRANLRALCAACAEPLRMKIGRMKVTSGYRSEAVNKAVGGSAKSQHMKGEAMDFVPLDVPLAEAVQALTINLEAGFPFDQIIVYPDRGFIHISHTDSRENRREMLEFSDGKYLPYNEG